MLRKRIQIIKWNARWLNVSSLGVSFDNRILVAKFRTGSNIQLRTRNTIYEYQDIDRGFRLIIQFIMIQVPTNSLTSASLRLELEAVNQLETIKEHRIDSWISD